MRQQRVNLTQQLRDQIGNDDITRVIIGELQTIHAMTNNDQ